MKLFRALICLGAAGFLLAASAHAKNLTDPTCGCQMTIPDSWTISHPGGPAKSYTLLTMDAKQKKSLSLFIIELGADPQGKPLDETSAIKGFEDGFAQRGGVIVSRDRQKVGDMNFYVANISQTVQGASALKGVAWIAVANGQMYQIGLHSRDTDPATDPDLVTIIHSFKLTPGKLL